MDQELEKAMKDLQKITVYKKEFSANYVLDTLEERIGDAQYLPTSMIKRWIKELRENIEEPTIVPANSKNYNKGQFIGKYRGGKNDDKHSKSS